MEELKNIIKTISFNFADMDPAEAAAWDAEIERREAAQEAANKIDLFHKSGVPERYWQESLDTYLIQTEDQKTAAKAATRFLHYVKCGEFKTLVMIGNAGTGKTHLACAIIKETGGQYRTAPDIVEELRRAKSFTAAETEAQIINYYSRVSLLVIDEIGRGIVAADEKYMLYMIINARYNTRKPTILISNFNKSEFLQYIGVAAADRLVESAEVIEFNGASYRRELRGNDGRQ